MKNLNTVIETLKTLSQQAKAGIYETAGKGNYEFLLDNLTSQLAVLADDCQEVRDQQVRLSGVIKAVADEMFGETNDPWYVAEAKRLKKK